MRLKNIKLAGFKSFVDPTNVQFNRNMVAVVGPNGCGKSNIIDAVRWVMGESSAKNLRGESMADVIFNGSTGRKPVGQASIELVFDNSAGTLQGEYGGFSEISIKRKVVRDGQSQYFLNGAKCRRRDITDIFLGTGLGPRSYAIIEQGMISRLIESKPEELRVFIEEAAGISKYKDRRRETETRIRHTRENLERLTDLRDELERQLQKLKRQASAAEKYKTFKAEERELRAQTLSLQWQSLRDRSSGQRERISTLEISVEESVAEQRGIDARVEALREEQVEKTEAFNKVQGSYYGVGAEIARLEQSIEHCEQRAKQLAEDIAETERNTAESRQHLEDDRKKLAQWREELEVIEPEHEQLAASESKSSEALSSAEQNMQDWQQCWDDFNERAAEPQKNAEIQRTRIDQIEESLTGLASRMERLSNERVELESVDNAAALSVLAATVAQSSASIASKQQALEQGSSALREAREQQRRCGDELDSERGQLQQLRGKLASLDALQEAARESEGGARRWLAQNHLDSAPRLLQQLRVDSGWETAVETVLGASLQAVTVDSIDRLSDRLGSLGDANVDFVETAQNAPPANNPAVGLPALSEKVSGAVPAQLTSIFVASDLQQALQARSRLAAGESVVTREGIWLGSNWLRVYKSRDAASGALAREQEIASLREQVVAGEARIEAAQQRREQAEAKVAGAEQAKDRLLQEKSQLEAELGRARAEHSALQSTIEQVAVRLKRSAEEFSLAESNQQQQRAALTNAREQLDTAIEAMQQVEEQRESLLLERDKVRDALSVSRESARTDRDALQAVAVRAEGLKAQVESVASSVARLDKQVEQLTARQASLRETQKENDAPVQGYRDTLASQLQARMLVETELATARKAVEGVDHAMREADQQRHKIEEQLTQTRSQLEKARIESQEMEVRSKTIVEQLQESGFELEQVLAAMPAEAELSSWQERLAEVEQRIERLGAINLAAIEEFQTESERKRHLDAQNDELETALATLENAIHKIDKETRNLFKETFDALNESVGKLFPKVFGGGAAYLEMTGDDLLSTGITIMAQPPGKKNSTIHLLSGGEKALTAIALVFSIFQLNPAPFCMLDEVDAPLDDANTARYARLINEMSDKVQFIFITHNKITMEMAEHLMGVTMHEPGVSRLVSVDIDEAVALATA
ncbi:MAG: chromosome segregation protein SMC [Gammaproteobacteria bacterium]|nr:chromosome segregation protein SMC [Gammaproteobacteria bacterium]NNM12344.1 chromosome segregation protein SMC [Pseudomonadales bacterium]